MTPELCLEELRKLAFSKRDWLTRFGDGKKFPETLIETRRRELETLEYAVSKFEIWVAKRAEDTGK
jgi:hypothetical protein